MTALNNTARMGQQGALAVTSLRPSAKVLKKLSDEDRDRLDEILAEPVDYTDSECFSKVSTAKTLFAEHHHGRASTRPWCNAAPAANKNTSRAPARTCTLTTEQEQRLFLRYNYARYRAAILVRKFAGKRLTAKATSELLWWHGQAMTTRCEIVQANLPLVLAMVKRTRLGNIDYAELVSEGNMALLRSVHKFDCGRGFKFSTYACRAILKSFSRVAMKTSRYRGRFPTEFDPSLEKSNYIEHCRAQHKADCVDELRGIIRQNSAELNEVEVKVIRARFALGAPVDAGGPGPQTLEQVGLLIGVTKERVRQIQNRALAKLRVKLQDDFLAA